MAYSIFSIGRTFRFSWKSLSNARVHVLIIEWRDKRMDRRRNTRNLSLEDCIRGSAKNFIIDFLTSVSEILISLEGLLFTVIFGTPRERVCRRTRTQTPLPPLQNFVEQ